MTSAPILVAAKVSERATRECRMTTASAPMACSVSAVSFSDSPFDTLEPLVEKLMTSAERRFAASSNEMRVRVEFS